jgi:hypothetical protein
VATLSFKGGETAESPKNLISLWSQAAISERSNRPQSLYRLPPLNNGKTIQLASSLRGFHPNLVD